MVLDTINVLSAEGRSKHDRDEAITNLTQLEQPEAVCQTVIKELLHPSNTNHRLLILAELLMDVGDLDTLGEPLWDVIQSPTSSDATKDAANLVLRNLGDTSDPDAYLEFLEDPEGLIAQETARMLQVATENPASLVDFLDFIVSLPATEQVRLLESLREDYPADQLLILYVALYWYGPNTEVVTWLQKILPTLPTPAALLHLEAMAEHTEDTDFKATLQRECQKRRLKSGFGHDADDAVLPTHPLHAGSTPHVCYATLPDGVGNVGLMMTRRIPNGDTCLMAMAANDQTGVLDAFGFYQLSDTDVQQLVDKFHEASLKISIPPAVAVALMQHAWHISANKQHQIPYEYTCWAVLLADITPADLDITNTLTQHANPAWAPITEQLYLHPDIHTWFLDGEDDPAIATLLKQAAKTVAPLMEKGIPADEPEAFEPVREHLDTLATTTIAALLNCDFGPTFAHRVTVMATLLQHANTQTFATLAATEALALNAQQAAKAKQPITPETLTAFSRAFGRRCVMEHLLRLAKQHPELETAVALLVDCWEPDAKLPAMIDELHTLPTPDSHDG